MDPASLAAIQPELISGERVLWTGQPETNVILHKEDAYLIPFSLLWGGFAIFWEYSASGGFRDGSHPAPLFFLLWGIPFVVVGQYMIWGRFFYAAWKKKRTHYAVTERRVIVVEVGRRRKSAAAYLDTLPALIRENTANGIGVLRFSAAPEFLTSRRGWASFDSMAMSEIPTFMDIQDVESVYRLIADQRAKLSTAKTTFAQHF